MTLFVPESIKVLGSDAGGASVVLCDMFVDGLADLPAPDAYTGYKLSMGCTATVINDNSKHRINSAGQWIQIVPGNSTYTRAEIDAMISAINADLQTKATIQQVYGIPSISIVPAAGETADLNDYVTPGTYLIPTSAVSARIVNAPFTDKGYKMLVEQYRNGYYYKQTIFAWSDPGAFYTRTRAGGATWSAWYKFEGE